MFTSQQARMGWHPGPHNQQRDGVLLRRPGVYQYGKGTTLSEEAEGIQRRRFMIGWLLCMLVLLPLCWMGSAFAQLPPPGTASQFELDGFLQEATLSGTTPLSGGTLKVNDHVVVVPDNTIVILPANALTWQELFSNAPPPYKSAGTTGLALTDSPAPLSTYEVHVAGNRVGDTYIAGLIFISQQFANAGAGYINYIDYANGAMYVGGALKLGATGVPLNQLDPANTGVKVSLNDPGGRFGRAGSPDPRFTLDPDNPTVRSVTGFPMCLPRSDPNAVPAAPDALCPEGNRPKDGAGNYLTIINMSDPATLAANQLPDPRVMMPFEVGDYVTYSGTLVGSAGTSGPYPAGSTGTSISAHTVVNTVAVYTAAGKSPAYAAIDVALIGTGGATAVGATEATIRTRFEGFTTDTSRNIHLYGIDVDPATGKPTDRDWGTVGVDNGPPGGGIKGRWRFRPPCIAATATFKACTPAAAGTFLPPTREVRAVVEGAWTPATTQVASGGANNLMAGQYHAPILTYIFPENVPGTVPPPDNFETMGFLANGGYTSSTGVLAGQLKPWPGASAPGSCGPPTANAGTDFTVAANATSVQLSGSASGTGTLTYQWSGEPSITKITNPTALNATFDVPQTTPPTSAMVLTLKVTGCNAQTTSSAVHVAVLGASSNKPVIAPITPVTLGSNTPVTLNAVSSGGSSVTYAWTQLSGPAQTFTQTPPTIGPQIAFTHAVLNNQVTPDVLTYSVVSTIPGNPTAVPPVPAVSSDPVTATVTLSPMPDTDTITTAVFRTSKQRLDLTATSSIVNPGLSLTLMPYMTVKGTMFDPASIGAAALTNNGNGNYLSILVGVPQPAAGAVLQVKSSINGKSPMTALTLLRT